MREELKAIRFQAAVVEYRPEKGCPAKFYEIGGASLVISFWKGNEEK